MSKTDGNEKTTTKKEKKKKRKKEKKRKKKEKEKKKKKKRKEKQISISFLIKPATFQQHTLEPPHDKTNKVACIACAPSLIKVFAVRMKKVWVLGYPLSAKRRLWSDRADAQADLRIRWAHSHIVGFVMRRHIIWRAISTSVQKLCLGRSLWMCLLIREKWPWLEKQ